MSTTPATAVASPTDWQDPSRTPAERVASLIQAMTLEEKVAQLGSVWPGVEEVTGNVAPMQDVLGRQVDYAEAIEHGIGHLTRVFGTAPVTAAEGVARVRRLQDSIVSASRLGVPALVHEECLTGFTSYQATVYPTALAWGATFDPALVNNMASRIGRDMAALGIHQALSPVLDVVRDYRWGRVEETIGEDPYLVSQLAAAYVRGLEDSGIIATLKHFAGYSASRAARNHAPVAIGSRELADIILPPFEYAVREAGVRSVMNSYTDIDGVPAAADPWLLTDVLRARWGFTGTVVSDYWAIPFLKTMHRVTSSFGEAGTLALAAGIDVELPNVVGYGQALVDQVRTGKAAESLVDRALQRLLRQKLELGLLEADWSVQADESTNLDSPENRAVARRLAEKSIVLVENAAGILPLTLPKRIAVIGPCADDPQVFFGCYAFPKHVTPQFPGFDLGIHADSLLTALRSEFPDAAIDHRQGCAVTGGDLGGLADATSLAQGSDLVILAVGDRAGLFGQGTSGEGCDAPDLALPGHQHELVEAVLATGRPVILVSVSGRPYALGQYAQRTAAIVQGFFPGEEGGGAIAGVLSGRVNPSGKLPVQIPRHPGGQPQTYLAPPLGQNSEGVSNLDPTPAFAFGHGLSYTTFSYSAVATSASEIPTDGTVEISVTVSNDGDRPGDEVVQLYLQDPVASITRPVTQLVGFQRLTLDAKEAARVTFAVHADRVSFTGRALTRIVEPGELNFTVGTSGSSFLPAVTVHLVGAVRELKGGRVMDTPVSVGPAV